MNKLSRYSVLLLLALIGFTGCDGVKNDFTKELIVTKKEIYNEKKALYTIEYSQNNITIHSSVFFASRGFAKVGDTLITEGNIIKAVKESNKPGEQ